VPADVAVEDRRLKCDASFFGPAAHLLAEALIVRDTNTMSNQCINVEEQKTR
jgi:hypothetical protein